jgi:hypothetical protein
MGKLSQKLKNRARLAWAIADRYLWGTSAGKLVIGAVLGVALGPVLPAPVIGALTEPVNQILDAVSVDPA